MTSATLNPRVQFPSSLFLNLLSAVVADRSPEAATSLLRQAGFEAGEQIAELLRERTEEELPDGSLASLPAPRFWEAFADFWDSMGWGTLEYEQVHPGVAALTSTDWAEADAAAGTGCQLTTGIFADILRRVAGEDVAVLEAECRGRGDSRCRFLFGSPATLSTLYDSLRSGQGVEHSLSRLA
jgi:predicted hydrocarbon binding protein